MKIFWISIALTGLVAGAFFVFLPDLSQSILITPTVENPTQKGQGSLNEDIERQPPLANPPAVIKAVYATSWSAGTPKKLDSLIKLITETDLNAIVIDIKAFDGIVAYDIENQQIERYKTKEIRIPKINTLIKKLHDQGIYAIARLTVFQDPVLAKARPDLAVKSKASGGTWYDRKGLAWMEPAAQEVWDYNVAIARDAADRGFDEINFDYIRFPSDGNDADMAFGFYNATTTLKETVINDFFKYLRTQLAGIKISADVFGQVTVDYNDVGIGQKLEDVYENFDYVAPMVYPSHYVSGFIGYTNPAQYPYEIVKYSMDSAVGRLLAQSRGRTATSTPLAHLRPWLQAFDLGAIYTPAMIHQQINAVYEAATSTPELLNGYMLWNPSNIYSKESVL